MSLLEPLIALALIVIAVLLVDALKHHWLTEIGLYAILSVKGAVASFFVYGGIVDQFHDLKSRLRKRGILKRHGSDGDPA